MRKIQAGILLIGAMILTLQLAGWLSHPAESAKRYQYKVISITGTTELRKQADADQGRVAAIERAINEQAEQGWDFFQADGYVLYFRR